MEIGALIPARIGSKRLPKKNIKVLGGKPLLCWTVDTALEAGVFSDVTVSTESDEVAHVVREHYPASAVRVLKRPPALASDDAPLAQVLEHYLQERPRLAWAALLMPTFPFRRSARIREAVRAVYSGYPWRVVSVTRQQHCSMDYYYPVKGGVRRFFSNHPLFASLNLPVYEFFHRRFLGDFWKQHGMTSLDRLYRLHVDLEESVDIDTENDFRIAQRIASGGVLRVRRPVMHDLGAWWVVVPEGTDQERYLDRIGRHRLEDPGLPLLVLERARPGVTFLRLQEGFNKSYWLDTQALCYALSPEASRTGNSAYIREHYRQSEHYRFLRKDHGEGVPGVSEEHDGHGILFGISPENARIPWDRIVLYDRLAAAEDHVEPVYVT